MSFPTLDPKSRLARPQPLDKATSARDSKLASLVRATFVRIRPGIPTVRSRSLQLCLPPIKATTP